ncbi:MAG: hypothetical protein A2787_06450 [Omnitrophica WOR_2 bacterium RIFCSPHIGHO2_01_FULL_48_9]|nr:MAG: hypothetical protein A3D10_09195 [Omnitrophica WOR_2 bacterium RIFCSPHIGHO2_02_FULL_48_11]OGX31294.1 MAG: hypothetical protein A2787_06450 [Omnitrophica WOR_2 bacterium RIFCSPHIGHO2_01_FULL_48_9]
MSKAPGLLSIFVGVVWVAILFFSFIYGLKKTFKQPPRDDSHSAAKLLEEQRQRTADLAEQQKRLMEDRKSRLRDMQKR